MKKQNALQFSKRHSDSSAGVLVYYANGSNPKATAARMARAIREKTLDTDARVSSYFEGALVIVEKPRA